MRSHSLRVLKRCVVACGIGASLIGLRARAEEPALSVRIEPAPTLVAGTTANIDVVVRVPEGTAEPLMLTPSTLGDSLHAVRGRLLRADARVSETGELRFAIPVAAHRAGTSLLRIDVLTYRCRMRCVALRASASQPLQVQSP